MIAILLIVLSVSIVLYLLKLNYEYWERRGVPGPKPRWIVGNVGESFLMKKNPGEIYLDIYARYPDEPLVGVFRAGTPVLLIRDPELIKEVTTKSFRDFRDNDFYVDKKADPIFGRNPFCLKGDEWKMVRAQMTSGFTSGRMKWLYPHLEEISVKLVKYIAEQPEALDGRGCDTKEVCTRFTLNNVASCAFGIDGRCFEEENSEFRQLAKDFLSPGSWPFIVFYLMSLIPVLTKVLSVRLTPKKVEKKLLEIVTQTLKYRKENNIVRNDFLHIVNQLKGTCKDYTFTDVDVTAHAAGFFGDGYETSGVTMMKLLFELATSPEAQSRLREEVVKKFEANDDRLSYDDLQEMSYLDAVFCETMRLHSPVHSLFKLCTNTHTFTSGKLSRPVTIEKDTPVVLPVMALQKDPKYFEDPEAFRPERFLGANREKIDRGAYLPFGEGPRSCLGQRFGILQIKCGVAHVIRSYSLSLNKKTQVPLKYDAINGLFTPVGGVWIDFKKI